MRLSYPTSPEFEKLGFEREFLRYITRLEEDNQRRIKKNKDKLRANDEHGYVSLLEYHSFIVLILEKGRGAKTEKYGRTGEDRRRNQTVDAKG